MKRYTLEEVLELAKVAPRRGAWVETGLSGYEKIRRLRSHPAGVRGLKHRRVCQYRYRDRCRTPQGCVG